MLGQWFTYVWQLEKKIINNMNLFNLYKTLAIVTLFMSVLLYPQVSIPLFVVAMVFARAHAFGAWFSMWRAKRINWMYVIGVFVMTFILSYAVMRLGSYELWIYITSVLFFAHYFIDEYIFQNKKIIKGNVLFGFIPFVTVVLLFTVNLFQVNISYWAIAAIDVLLLGLLFIQSKKISKEFLICLLYTSFFWATSLIHMQMLHIFGILLVIHYGAWFVYPVLKLHIYRRDERDEFIMMIILILSTSIYYTVTANEYSAVLFELGVKWFLIFTLVHVLSSAPFGYIIGLKKSEYSPV